MNEKIFSGTAQVEVQGPRVLRFVALTDDAAEFEIIGLTKPQIQVIDKRPAVKRSMSQILKTGKVENLARYFNKPARVTIFQEFNGILTVNLDKTRAKKPRHMLWVAIGIGEKIPYYHYKEVELQQLDDGKFALFSLYKRPR